MILKRLKTQNEVSESEYKLKMTGSVDYISMFPVIIVLKYNFSKIYGKIFVTVIKLKIFKSGIKCFKIKQIRVDTMQELCKNTLKHLDLEKPFFI